MAKLKDPKDAISWSSSLRIKKKILDQYIVQTEKEAGAEAKMNEDVVDEESVVNA